IAENKNITIVNEINRDIIIEANKDKVSQVALNLLSNAISYSKVSEEVIVRVFKEGNKRILEVQDFGIGISEQDQKHIFERFYRVDKARSRDSGGTGLGLSITKHIMEAHHGRINVFSELEKGSTFRVTFFEYNMSITNHFNRFNPSNLGLNRLIYFYYRLLKSSFRNLYVE